MCITHELSTIQDADKIIFLDKDESGVTTISGSGAYDELIKTCPTFKRWHSFKWPNSMHVQHTNENHSNSDLMDPNSDNMQQSSESAQFLLRPQKLQRSLTWSKNRSITNDVEFDSHDDIESSLFSLSKQNFKMYMKEMQWEMQQQQLVTLRGNEKTIGPKIDHWMVCQNNADFRRAQRKFTEMPVKTIARILPYYDKLLRHMRIRVSEYTRRREASPWVRLFRRHHKRDDDENGITKNESGTATMQAPKGNTVIPNKVRLNGTTLQINRVHSRQRSPLDRSTTL